VKHTPSSLGKQEEGEFLLRLSLKILRRRNIHGTYQPQPADHGDGSSDRSTDPVWLDLSYDHEDTLRRRSFYSLAAHRLVSGESQPAEIIRQ
jgi:hypothetical protein